jgi:hypothetical protein
MTPSAFRAVVAGTLVAALVLAMVITVLVLGPKPGPEATASLPGASPSGVATATPPGSSSPAMSPTPPPAVFGSMDVVGAGDVARGGTSATTVSLRFLKTNPAAIPSAPGSFQVTLSDAAGQPTIDFVGTPSVVAPDSLGASATLVAGNVLEIHISGSDPANAELLTINGLSIKAFATAALGPITASVGAFRGSLAAGVDVTDLPSPGTVVASR